MNAPVNVICMKWGTKFPAEYVNRLYRMVQRNLTLPHRFVCFTDDGTDIAEGVEIKPLPSMDLPPGKERGWRKLSTFQKPLADLEGKVLFLDLDVLILDNIDDFFTYPGDFCIIHDWLRPARITGNSSVYRFEAGAHPEVFQYFIENIDTIKGTHRHEQAYLSAKIAESGELTYWPTDWCVSFKRHCLPPFPQSLWKVPEPPKGPKILVFHGSPTPEDAIAGKIKGPFRFLKPTPWIAQYWQ